MLKWYIRCVNLIQLEYWEIFSAAKSLACFHQLRFRFVNSRFTILFTNGKTHADHFFISAGIFTRYFFFQKSVKRSKALKLLMTRFARKMLILLELKSVELLVRGAPYMFEQLILTLLSSLRHPFINPLTGKLFDEVNTLGSSLYIRTLTFVNSKSFGFMKTRLKGRIKRKIRRRIHRLNRSDC